MVDETAGDDGRNRTGGDRDNVALSNSTFRPTSYFPNFSPGYNAIVGKSNPSNPIALKTKRKGPFFPVSKALCRKHRLLIKKQPRRLCPSILESKFGIHTNSKKGTYSPFDNVSVPCLHIPITPIQTSLWKGQLPAYGQIRCLVRVSMYLVFLDS